MNNDTPADAITQADILAWHKVQNAIAAQAIVEQKAAKKRGQPIGRELARKDALAFLSRYSTTSLAAQDLVKQWMDEWTATHDDHWGDLIDWATAREIARRIDEAKPAPSLAAQDGLVDALRASETALDEAWALLGDLREDVPVSVIEALAATRAALASIEVKSS